MNGKPRIRNSTLAVIVGLIVSVWWIFMGLDLGFRFEAPDTLSLWLTLGGYRHTIMTGTALVLVPLCALEKRWVFLVTMVVAGTTLVLSVVHVGHMVLSRPAEYESQLFGPVVWSVIQIPIFVFSALTWRMLSGDSAATDKPEQEN